MPLEGGLHASREGLELRRSRLRLAIASSPENAELRLLLGKVDAALERIGDGTYGLCEACHEPIESDRLLADPLTCFCLDHLTAGEQRALEHDLSLASSIQKRLLPEPSLDMAGWTAGYRYLPAGPVSGDYCDLLAIDDDLFFFVGDVSGKGVSAAMVMSHLHATLRALLGQQLSLDEVMGRASRMLCENTLPSHFATMAGGKAGRTGEVQLCIAGHTPVLVSAGSEIRRIESTAMPLGMFGEQRFSLETVHVAPGETLLLHTDGVSEALDESGREYGVQRLADVLAARLGDVPGQILAACVDDLHAFRSPESIRDDVTIMVLRRRESSL